MAVGAQRGEYPKLVKGVTTFRREGADDWTHAASLTGDGLGLNTGENRELHGGCSDLVSGTARGLPAGSTRPFAMLCWRVPRGNQALGCNFGRNSPLRLIWR